MRQDFPAFAVVAQIVGAGVENDAHELVFAGLILGKQNLALALEHPGDAALFAEVAAVLGKHVADLAHGAIAIVGGDHHQNRGAAGAVAFEHHLVDLAAFQFAGAAHDGLLDVVGRHAGSLGGRNRRAQAGIHIGIATGAGGDHDFFNDARETLSALGVESGFLVLDCRPFGMT